MTEPHAPQPDWDSLPVLTEVVDTPEPEAALQPPEVPVLVDFDIPDFDFDAEMAQLADALPDNELSFPSDLTLDEVLSAGEQSPDGGSGALDAEALIGRLPSLDLDVPLPDDMDLGEVLPGFAMPEMTDAVLAGQTAPPLETETLAAAPLPDDGMSPSLVPGDAGGLAGGMPEADLDNVPLLDTAEAGLTTAAAAAGLAAWLDQAAREVPPAVPPSADVPGGGEAAPWPPSAPAAEVGAAETDEGVAAELAQGDIVPPAAVFDEVLPEPVAAPAGIDGAAIDISGAAPGEPVAGAVPDVPPASGAMAGSVGLSPVGTGSEPLPAAGEVVTEAAVATVNEEAAAAPAADVVAPAADGVVEEELAAGDDFAFDLDAAEGTAPAGVAAAYVAALDATPDADVPGHGYPLGQSISLDSLPTGVLGGGLGLAAGLLAEVEGGGDMMPDREVELAWARDLGAEPPFDLTPQEAILPHSSAMAAPETAREVSAAAGLAAAAIQLSGVKEVSQPSVLTPVPEGAAEAPPGLDSEVLIDALYARVLPRMKVELTLWMQDALEMQARQLMSGVMQHLKEDFDMMLAEALRESLREAIREAKAGQGEQ